MTLHKSIFRINDSIFVLIIKWPTTEIKQRPEIGGKVDRPFNTHFSASSRFCRFQLANCHRYSTAVKIDNHWIPSYSLCAHKKGKMGNVLTATYGHTVGKVVVLPSPLRQVCVENGSLLLTSSLTPVSWACGSSRLIKHLALNLFSRDCCYALRVM